MAPLLADVSQGQALRLYQVECLARRSRAAVERIHSPQRFRYNSFHGRRQCWGSRLKRSSCESSFSARHSIGMHSMAPAEALARA